MIQCPAIHAGLIRCCLPEALGCRHTVNDGHASYALQRLPQKQDSADSAKGATSGAAAVAAGATEADFVAALSAGEVYLPEDQSLRALRFTITAATGACSPPLTGAQALLRDARVPLPGLGLTMPTLF